MPQNIPENEDDFIRMQQEAIRRVREMQERARRTLEDAGMPITPEPGDPFAPGPPAGGDGPSAGPAAAPQPAPQRAPSQREPSQRDPPQRDTPQRGPAQGLPGFIPPPVPPRATASPLGGLPVPLLQSLHLPLQNDQLLLVGLIYLLYRDGGDIYLIMALVFILLT